MVCLFIWEEQRKEKGCRVLQPTVNGDKNDEAVWIKGSADP